MKQGLLMFLLALSATVFAETWVKSSAPFEFWGCGCGDGVIANHSSLAGGSSFTSHVGIGAKNVVNLSWSVPAKAGKGSIAIFTLAGTRVKVFPITEAKGSINWDVSAGEKTANGVYLAAFSYGTRTKNLQILISR